MTVHAPFVFQEPVDQKTIHEDENNESEALPPPKKKHITACQRQESDAESDGVYPLPPESLQLEKEL